jgi:ribose transport system permease protein
MADALQVEPRQALKKKRQISTTWILFIVLLAMIAIFSLLSKDFYSFLNLSSMLTNISFSGIVAGTLTLIMITGGLDISIGGNIALTTCLAAYLFNLKQPVPGWALVPIALVLGAAIGAFNGLFITQLDLNPIITTLGTMAVTRGLGYVLTKSRSILIMEDVTGFIGRTIIPGIQVPMPLVFMVVTYALLFFVLGRSKFGRKIYCIGANQAAARVSGIRVNRVKFLLYLFSGIAASFSGLILTGQTAVGMPQHANGVELDVITAVLLGGTALSGGKGDILGTLVGVLILGVLYNGFTMIGFRFVHIRVFQGIILILIVALYEMREKKRY